MDAFNYLSVLVSIIIGLAITQILQSVRAIILYRREVKLYWPALVWAATLILIAVQMWWTTFRLSAVPEWTFAEYGVVLFQMAAFYMAAGLVLPDVGPTGGDLEVAYFANAPWFFGALILAALSSIAKDLVIIGMLPSGPNLAFHLIFITAALIAALTRSKVYHAANAPIAGIAFSIYIVALFAKL